MNTVRVSLLAGLLAGSGCCLTVVSGDTGNDDTSGGGGSTSGGGGTSGGGTSGGTTGGEVGCSGVYCSPLYVCDPTDGICKCGGEICNSGNCASTGSCLAGCPADAGYPYGVSLEGTPGEAAMLPPAKLEQTYDFQIAAISCAPGPLVFTALSPLPPGLAFYPSGEIEGVPTMATNGVPFEFEVEVQVGSSLAVQNFLLQVESSP